MKHKHLTIFTCLALFTIICTQTFTVYAQNEQRTLSINMAIDLEQQRDTLNSKITELEAKIVALVPPSDFPSRGILGEVARAIRNSLNKWLEDKNESFDFDLDSAERIIGERINRIPPHYMRSAFLKNGQLGSADDLEKIDLIKSALSTLHSAVDSVCKQQQSLICNEAQQQAYELEMRLHQKVIGAIDDLLFCVRTDPPPLYPTF